MTKFILPLIFLLTAVGAFIGFIDPTFKEIKILETQEAELDNALNNSNLIKQQREELSSRWGGFSVENLDRLHKLIPDNVDNVKLIVEIDAMASSSAIDLSGVSVSTSADPRRPELGIVALTFQMAGDYLDMIGFIQKIERSLRLVDITGLEFSASSDDFLQFNLNLNTYWLKKQ